MPELFFELLLSELLGKQLGSVITFYALSNLSNFQITWESTLFSNFLHLSYTQYCGRAGSEQFALSGMPYGVTQRDVIR